MNAVPLNAVPAARQKGVMLIIVLIVLVAMTLAGVAMMRSVDTSTVVAGNIAFKQSGVGAADQGLQTGYIWLKTTAENPATSAMLNSDSVADGYISNAPGTEPDWTNNANWANEKQLNGGAADGAGNIISYLIHRMCPVPNCAPDATCAGGINVCGSTANTATVSGEGVDVSKPAFFSLPPSIHYRITARTVGPRNTLTVVQTMVRTQ